MTPARRTWAIFAIGAGLLAAALALVSREALDQEERNRRAQAAALREERIRSAVWVMDAALTQALAVEAARPPWHYEPFHPASGPLGLIAPAPLFGFRFAPFRLHFQVDGEGRAASPGVAAPAVVGEDAAGSGESARRALEEFVRLDLSRGARTEMLRTSTPATTSASTEYANRAQRNVAAQQQAMGANLSPSPIGDPALEVGLLVPRWVPVPGEERHELLVIRTVRTPTRTLLQGIWIDWPALREWLLATVREEFPAADLVPLPGGAAAGHPRTLASIPARFEPGPAPPLPRLSGLTPVRGAVVLGWAAVAAAAVLAGLALRGALDLGERRGRFVSAVTHELRTPLTTFRMYAQMLSEGMAPPGAEKEYLETLRRESERLSRVVESVLLYARLEEGRGGAHRERLSAAALLDRVLPVAERRLAECGLAPAVSRDLPEDAMLEVDPQAVEQVVLNLADNACKYAAGGGAVALEARTEGGRLLLAVDDRGPGIPPGKAEEVFEAFRRLERDAAGGAPGAGLGLAIARGLARALGGDLVLVPRDGPGARFVLSLPLRA